jgi:hypothetical protein
VTLSPSPSITGSKVGLCRAQFPMFVRLAGFCSTVTRVQADLDNFVSEKLLPIQVKEKETLVVEADCLYIQGSQCC